MRKTLLLAAGAAALWTSHAVAADVVRPYPAIVPAAPVVPFGIMGYAGIGGASFDGDISGGGVDSIRALAFHGAVNVPVAGVLNVEFEGVAAEISAEQGGTSETVAYSRAMVHGFARLPGWAIGAFGGFENLAAVPIHTFGAEAQAYLGKIVLYGQVASHHVDQAGTSADWTSARGALQFFLTDNLYIEGDIRNQFDFGGGFGGSGVDALTVAGTIEARFAGSPWSAFAMVRNTSFSDGIEEDITSGLVGIRANFGSGSLYQNATQGASMNTLPLF